MLPVDTSEFAETLNSMNDLVSLTHLCSTNLEVGLDKKQELLETIFGEKPGSSSFAVDAASKENLQVKTEIREKLSDRMGKMQREAILHSSN